MHGNFSKKGTIRSNHYHKKIKIHYIYIVKGEILWAYKKIHKDSKLILKKLKKGSLFFTPPMQEHFFAYFIKIVIYWHLVREQEKKDLMKMI